MKLTLVDYLDQAVMKYGDRTAWIHESHSATYSELGRRTGSVATAIHSAQLTRGDRCAYLLKNRPEVLEILFGTAAAGMITVPINFRSVEREIIHILDNATPRILIFEAEFSQLVGDIRSTPSATELTFICIGDSPSWATPYEDWLAQTADTIWTRPQLNAADPFFFGYTSGTTGAPKGALISHEGLIRNNFALMLEYNAPSLPDDRFLTLMPMFHSNSTWFGTCCVMVGATNVIATPGTFRAETLLATIEQYDITHCSVVPTMLKMVADLGRQKVDSFDTSSLQWFLCGSAPLSLMLKKEIESLVDAQLSEGYGATEIGVASSLRQSDPDDKKASVGRPMIGTVIAIRDADGTDLAAGEVGEIWSRGETSLLLEYWNNEAATRSAYDADGWLSVGDMGYLDEDGFLYLTDRKNDMIISGGENIYPSEVEGVLLTHPAIHEAAVISVPDELWGEVVKAVVSLKHNLSLTEADVISFCREQLAGFKTPRIVTFVDELPKSPTGKILRRLVRDGAQQK